MVMSVTECPACRQSVSETRSIDDIELCIGCAEKLSQIRSDASIACDGCGQPFYGDARIAWICRESGGSSFCDRCSFAFSRRKGMSA